MKKILAVAASTRWMRRVALPILERFNPGDVHIRHHYTRQRVLLHSFRHKGYWFHGARREQSTMQFFQRVLRKGDTVLEVGGHIGYLTMWFAELVGPTGQVKAFEPGSNNLPYLRANTDSIPNVELIELAVANADGTANFYEEGLTGQNNSLLGDYRRFSDNRQNAFSHQEYCQREVATIRLDTFVSEHSIRAELIKIDIEGAEYLALAGATKLLSDQHPMLMVEVTERAAEVGQLLRGYGYELFKPTCEAIGPNDALQGNVCALHPVHHLEQLARWRGLNALSLNTST